MPLTQRHTDYHCHILPGLDDGPSDMNVSLEMAHLFAAAGYREVYCTPHAIKGMFDASTEDVLQVRNSLQQKLEKNGIAIKLLVGREYYLDEFLLNLIQQPMLLEGTTCIMIEIPANTSVDLVKETLFAVKRRGYTPLIAHPERCQLLEMPDHPPHSRGRFKRWLSGGAEQNIDTEPGNDLLHYLKLLGCQFQANLGSINGQYGNRVKASALNFQKNGIYTHSGTDAHSPESLKTILGIT